MTCNAFIIVPSSEFYRPLARPRAQECISHHSPTLSSRVSVYQPARIWMVGSCISCRLVEMIFLTAFAVDVAAAVGAFCHPA